MWSSCVFSWKTPVFAHNSNFLWLILLFDQYLKSMFVRGSTNYSSSILGITKDVGLRNCVLRRGVFRGKYMTYVGTPPIPYKNTWKYPRNPQHVVASRQSHLDSELLLCPLRPATAFGLRAWTLTLRTAATMASWIAKKSYARNSKPRCIQQRPPFVASRWRRLEAQQQEPKW